MGTGMKIRKDLLQDFIEEFVEPVLEQYLDGEITINYEKKKDSPTFIVNTPSIYNLVDVLFGEPMVNYHASHAKFHKFGIPKGIKDGMLKVECYYMSYRFYLLFNFTKGSTNGSGKKNL
jgi:hypothetical protein